MRTVKVEIGDREVEIPCLNLEQIEEVNEILQAGLKNDEGPRTGFKIFRVAMKRAVGADLNDLAPTIEQIRKTVDAVMKASGFKDDQPDPPAGEASATS